uniref:Uncharacterized protein n=1 Tax=Daucus carota subsp. sativus TaxID=79200 RepID=A0A162B3Y8_DAUCS
MLLTRLWNLVFSTDWTVYYSPILFQDAGISDKTRLLAATDAVGFTENNIHIGSYILIDKIGRKPCFM